MERVAIVARLKEGSRPRAAELIAAGPPFDLGSAGEVVFVFEGHEVEWVISDPFRPKIQGAFDRWRSIVDGPPRIARERFGWQAQEGVPPATEAVAGSAR